MSQSTPSVSSASVQASSTAPDCQVMHQAIERLADEIARGSWIASPDGTGQVLGDLQALRADLAAHIAMMEGPDGLTECVSSQCPHLHRQINMMCSEHVMIRQSLAELEEMLTRYHEGQGAPEPIQQLTRDLLSAMRTHQETGNRLILDAFSSDLGVAD